jgi:V/A-type H+-transporting ATPase subunit I
LASVGWAIAVLGAMSLWVFGTTTEWARMMCIIGAGMVFLFTSDRPLNSFANIMMRPIEGFLGLANISKAFGDAMSYLRLFALGLASAKLAEVFNGMAGMVTESFAGIGVFLAVLILIFGHSLNFILGIMGGVVHGLRLNMIEFFSWSITDEGYAFIPFNRKEKQQWNNSQQP